MCIFKNTHLLSSCFLLYLLGYVCLSCFSGALLKLISVRNLDDIFLSLVVYISRAKRLTGIFTPPQKLVSKRDHRVHQRSSIYEGCSQPGSVSFCNYRPTATFQLAVWYASGYHSNSTGKSTVWDEILMVQLQLVWRSGLFLYCGSTKAAISLRTLSLWAKSIFFDICSKVQGSGGDWSRVCTKDGLWRGLTGPGVTISSARGPAVPRRAGGWRGATGSLFRRHDRRPRWITQPGEAEDNGRFQSSMENSMGINKTRLSEAFELRANNHIFRATLPWLSSNRGDPVLTVERTCCLCCNISARGNEFMLHCDSEFISHRNSVSEWHVQWAPYSKCHTKHIRWIEPPICRFYIKFIVLTFVLNNWVFCFCLCHKRDGALLLIFSSQQIHRVLTGSHLKFI